MLDIIYGLSLILLPLIVGYLIPLKRKSLLGYIHYIVIYLLYGILFVLGFNLGQLDNLASRLPIIGVTAFTLSACIIGSNLVFLIILDLISPIAVQKSGEALPSYGKLLWDSVKLCSIIVIGLFIGLLAKGFFSFPHNTNAILLMIIVFFIGIQMRNSGIQLKEAFVNKRGFVIGTVFAVSALLGGIIAAYFLAMPLSKGLALASGFGWYTLSSTMMADAWGAEFGSIAFLNDLSREILGFFLIPLLMQRFSNTAVGISGAAALDFTLPIIQKSGGMVVVPIAISFGMIVNLLPPVLMVLFSSLS